MNIERAKREDPKASRPTLLAVSPVPPWPASDGMALRVSRMLEELADRWSIVLVCPSGGDSAASHGVALAAEIRLTRTGEWMYLPSQYDVGPVLETVSEVLHVHRPRVALLWGGMEYLRREISEMPPAVGDRVDCMTLSAWRQISRARGFTARRRRVSDFVSAVRYELRVRETCSATVVVGEEDARVLRRVLGMKNVHVVPNGVDVPAAVSRNRASRPTVIFTGVLSYQPNIDAVAHFAEDIWPLVRARVPDALFQIVGRSPGPHILAFNAKPGIEIHADVPSVHEFLGRAWLSVAPMRSGSGLKNKILESWSVGTPAVMTPIATNGLTGAPGELLLAAEGDELATLVGDLLLDSKRREELGVLARTTATKDFSWKANADALDRLLRSASL
jgi:glycosyltransferase involved in cell wall biosynthesis